MDPIEPRIRPLVDALNETHLIETFSSCQGHFGEPQSPDDFTDRTKAHVRAYFLPEVPEGDVEDLILRILSDYMDDSTKWEAHLTISKQYIADPRENGVSQALDAILVVELWPFNPNTSALEKRRAVDRLIEETTVSVRAYGKARANRR